MRGADSAPLFIQVKEVREKRREEETVDAREGRTVEKSESCERSVFKCARGRLYGNVLSLAAKLGSATRMFSDGRQTNNYSGLSENICRLLSS